MALAEHEVTQITVRLAEAQAAKLGQAAAAQGQSIEDFIVSASVRAADAPRESLVLPAGRDPLDSIFGIFKDEPLMEALMERIHADQRREIEQFWLEAEAEEVAEQAKAAR